MKETAIAMLILIVTFFAGFLLGEANVKTPKPLQSLTEQVLNDQGTRIVTRHVEPLPREPITPDAGPVVSDVRVKARALAQPETLVELHLQEIQTPEGPRMVVEAPDGWRIEDAIEHRTAKLPSVAAVKKWGLGPSVLIHQGTAEIGMMGVYQRGNWEWSLAGYRNGGMVSAVWRF